MIWILQMIQMRNSEFRVDMQIFSCFRPDRSLLLYHLLLTMTVGKRAGKIYK